MIGFIGNALVKFLAVFIVLVDGLSFLVCVVQVAAYKQVYSLDAALHSS